MEKSKVKLLIGIILILLMVAIGILVVKNSEIKLFEIADFSSYFYSSNMKYKITNEDELKKFAEGCFSEVYRENYYSKFEEMLDSEHINLNECDFSKNTIFMEIYLNSSSDDKVKLKNVSIDDKLKFNISKQQKWSLSGMSIFVGDTYLLIAIIPNSKLEGIDTEEWKLPSESIKTDWKITVYMTGIRSSDVEKIIKEIKQEGEQFIYNEVKVNGVVQDIAVDKIEIITNDVNRYKELTKWFNDKEYVEKINTRVSSTEINNK